MKKFTFFSVFTLIHFFAQASDGEHLKDSFDPQLESLPVNFKGHNRKILVDFLSKNIFDENILKKDEFETTDSHKIRLDNFTSNNFEGNLNLKNTRFAFVIDNPTIDFKYDADKSSLEYVVCLGSYFDKSDKYFYKKPGKNSINSRVTKETLGFKDMQNSYGARVKVEFIEHTRFEYVVYGGKIQTPTGKPCEIKGEIKLNPDEAKVYKKNGYSLLVYGKLVSPFISKSSLVTEPTLSDPRLITSTDYSIHIQEEGLWLIDSVSGRIFKKIF